MIYKLHVTGYQCGLLPTLHLIVNCVAGDAIHQELVRVWERDYLKCCYNIISGLHFSLGQLRRAEGSGGRCAGHLRTLGKMTSMHGTIIVYE